MKRFLLLVFVLATTIGNAFDNQYNKHDTDTKISSFFLMGERCSGTKFVNSLISRNFNIEKAKFSHKHFIPWLNVSKSDKINSSQLTNSETIELFKNTEHVLFIFLVRDPYDWLRSFYQKPHHVKNDLKKNFSTFISHNWECYGHQSNPEITEVDNWNPWKGRKFKNVLELRKYKNLNFMQVSSFVKNYLLVRYEDVRDNQEEFIEFIASFYSMEKNEEFKPTLTYVGFKENNQEFKISEYFIPDLKQVLHINRSMDWNIERALGYFEKSRLDLAHDNR